MANPTAEKQKTEADNIIAAAKAEAEQQAKAILDEARAQAAATTADAHQRAQSIISDVTQLTAFQTMAIAAPDGSAANQYEYSSDTGCKSCGSKLQSILGDDGKQKIICSIGDPKCPRAGS